MVVGGLCWREALPSCRVSRQGRVCVVLGWPLRNTFVYCQPSPDAKPNLNQIVTDPPKLVNSTTHGKLLTVGDGDDLIYILHVWGKGCDLWLLGPQL